MRTTSCEMLPKLLGFPQYDEEEQEVVVTVTKIRKYARDFQFEKKNGNNYDESMYMYDGKPCSPRLSVE